MSDQIIDQPEVIKKRSYPKRGFASMDRDKVREIASLGGKACHQKGTGHEWTSETARIAGRLGGAVSQRKRIDKLVDKFKP